MQNFIYTNVGQALACVSSLFLSNYTIQSEKEKKRTEYWSRSQPGMPISCFINTLQRIPVVSRPESINTHALLVGMTRLRRPLCSCAPACTPSEPSRSPSTCTRSNISKSNCPYWIVTIEVGCWIYVQKISFLMTPTDAWYTFLMIYKYVLHSFNHNLFSLAYRSVSVVPQHLSC